MSTLHRLLRPLRGDRAATDEEPPVSDGASPDELSAAFTSRYGHTPAGVWWAPGQAALLGEHTGDSGMTLTTALPWGVSLALAPTDDGTLRVASRGASGQAVRLAPGRQPLGAPAWAGRVAGVVRAARESGQLPDGAGARVLVDSDLPAGGGFAAAAALECAVLVALAQAHGNDALAKDPAALARVSHTPGGGSHGASTGPARAAALRYSRGNALLTDRRSGRTSTVPLDPHRSGVELLVITPRQRHGLRAGTAGRRRAECARAARLLGVDALPDVADLTRALDTLNDPVLRRRVQHVVTEAHRVNAASGLLRVGAVGELGALLTSSHLSLRDQFAVSSPTTDAAVEASSAAARGARMVGGRGESALVLADAHRAAEVRRAVSAAFDSRGWPEPEVRPACPAAGAHRVDG
ncbi:galactokinase [Haloactinospora alba]|uniref:Galactokinase n=1 Tax=Haloactinospora alba TaxID=405555 RepID=A0A543NMA0_9ACTN|nr:galactokinase family protein [Haloactinospora alba]TQN32949.1 galactokinase [Haloactinospora alba]